MRSLEKPEAPPRRRWQHCSSSQGPVTLSRAFMLSHRQPFVTLSELRYCLGECRKPQASDNGNFALMSKTSWSSRLRIVGYIQGLGGQG